MAGVLGGIAKVLPMTYAVEALEQVGRYTSATSIMWRDLVIVVGAAVVALALAAATLRRRTD
jgi:ABC-2 type transport system permease protein